MDSVRILGAFLNNLRKGNRQGGSTLTQQLIKLTYFSTSTADQTLSRKIQEAWLAVQLERKATKQEIITYYVNKWHGFCPFINLEEVNQIRSRK